MKKTIALFLVFTILFITVLTPTVSGEDSVTEQTIQVNYGGKIFEQNVLKNKNGQILVPVTWLYYFGLMNYKLEDGYYKFFHPEQEDLAMHAKQTIIKEDGSAFDIRYYIEEPQKENANSMNIFAKLDYDVKKVAFDNFVKKKNANKFGSEDKWSFSLLSGKFSDQINYNKNLYLPIAEVLPLINADIVISKDGIVYINPHPVSISQALYKNDLSALRFDSIRDIAFADELAWSGYIVDTVLNFRIDRLDFITNSGEVSDYQKLFKSYLTDNEAYLSAFDASKTPQAEQFEILDETLDKGVTVLKSFEDGIFEWSECIMGKNGTQEALKELLPNTYPALFEETPYGTGKITGTDVVEGFAKTVDYLNTYSNQVDDHRNMLGSVFKYKATTTDKNAPVYRAAILTESLYGEAHDAKFMAMFETGTREAFWEFVKEVGEESALGTAFAPYKVTVSLLKVGLSKEFQVVEDTGLINHMDALVEKAYRVYESRYMSDFDFSIKGLEDLRLSAIMTLVASRHAYTSLWDENYDKIKDIDTMLVKLYMAADGVECDSTDYYGKKKDALQKNQNIIKTTDGWGNGKTQAQDASIVGTWGATIDGEYGEFKFNADFSGCIKSETYSEDFTWEINDDILTVFAQSSRKLNYRIDGNKLYLTYQGDTKIFERKSESDNLDDKTEQKSEYENLYLKYLKNGGFDKLLEGYYTDGDWRVKSSFLDMNEDGIPELLVILEDTSQLGVKGYLTISTLFTIRSGKVAALKTVNNTGGSMGGGELLLMKDADTGIKTIVEISNSYDGSSAFFGSFIVYSFNGEKIDEKTKCESIQYSYERYSEEANKLKESTNFYEDDGNSVSVYIKNGVYVSYQDWEKERSSYEYATSELKLGTMQNPF